MLRSLRLAKPNMRLVVAGVAACVLVAWVAADHGASAASRNGGLNLTAADQAPAQPSGPAARFGSRVLREGMTGPDVRVLKGIVRAKSLLVGSPVSEKFDRPTTAAVRRFQRDAKIGRSGVVNKATARRLVRSMGTAGASWYGPGFFGNTTACGQTLRPSTLGVAHRTLPCGSRVLIGYQGRYVITRVIDRGPFIRGRAWDLTKAVSDALGFSSAGVGKVRHAVINRR